MDEHHAPIAADRQTGFQTAEESNDQQDEQHNERRRAQGQRTATRSPKQVANAVIPRQETQPKHGGYPERTTKSASSGTKFPRIEVITKGARATPEIQARGGCMTSSQ